MATPAAHTAPLPFSTLMPPANAAWGRPQAVLGRIIDDLGSTLFEVVAGVPDHDRRVTGLLIHDPHDEAARLPGAILLGVAVYGADAVTALVRHAGGLGAVAVVVRGPVPVDAA